MKFSAAEVASAIGTGRWTNDELNSFVEALKYARSQLGKSVKQELRINSKVEWFSSKRGVRLTGTVKKIALKYVTVSTPHEVWRVPANMLEVV